MNNHEGEGKSILELRIKTNELLSDCHILPHNANILIMDSKFLCPFVYIHMRFLSVPHGVNVFRVR